MSSKKNKKKSSNSKAEKYLSYGTLIGLVIGALLGTVVFIITDNMFWMALSPIILMFLGLGIGSYLSKSKKKIVKKNS